MTKIVLGQTLEFGDTKPGLQVKVDINKLVDSRMLVEGNSGSGKSYLIRRLCELAAAHIPLILLDIEGEFASLREKIDAILIGPEGDIPTDLRSAKVLARKLVELRVSSIIDLYSLKSHERRAYVSAFLDALVNLPKDLWHPILIPIDEAHKFAPEKGQGDSTATQSVIDLMSLGRKRGYAGVPVTQRFSKLHNDVIAETNNVFIGRTWMDADVKRAADYLGLSVADRRLLKEL
jgi:DNA helicase HerA-like ATPase